MLILTRERGQRVLIGPDIEIVIAEVSRGGQVKIGIVAPRSVPILRAELAPHKAAALEMRAEAYAQLPPDLDPDSEVD